MFRRRWVRRLAVVLGVLTFLVVGGSFYIRHKSHQQGIERVEILRAHLDATDPRWRMEDIDADRGTLPDDENGARLVPRFKAALVQPSIDTFRPDKTDLFDKVSPNEQLDEAGAVILDRALTGNDAALAIARSFKDYPRSLRRYPVTPDVIGTLLPDVQEHRSAVYALTLEAERHSRAGRHGAALQLVPVMLNISRGMDGQPFLICALVRMGCDALAVKRAERTLALGVANRGLANVQTAVLAEAEADVFFGPLRAERAGLNHLFDNLRAGVVPPSLILSMAGPYCGNGPIPKSVVVDWAYEPFLPADQAACLDTMTRMYAVRSLPESKQRTAIKAIPNPEPGLGTQITHTLIPALDKFHEASLRHRAVMRCAGVALAVERFRLAFGYWPETLAELPKELLAVVPDDPFDGQPLKYVRRADGVTIYSVGYDEADNGGNVPVKWSKEPGVDLGFRLYDLDQRGTPPSNWQRPRSYFLGSPPEEAAP